ncbi:hypothetical protein L3Q67_25475 [Saccharothrix sp. AJ9571]|nr:hypothetical protein L3Q67_25475 [Saccharothrix sp. AJ9571]
MKRANLEFRLGGVTRQPDVEAVTDAAAQAIPESIREHWVEVAGQRWPPKQLLEIVTGVPRSAYTSHAALRLLRRAGFTTSAITAGRAAAASSPVTSTTPVPTDTAAALNAFRALVAFVSQEDFTQRIGRIEAELAGSDRARVAAVATEFGMTEAWVLAALLVRQHAGRLNDIIHAAAILQAMPLILEEGEHVASRPSLAAGNDPTRLFDLETNLRVAEFKLSAWKGADAMRKRSVFVDLALDETSRRKQLFVLGPEPVRFLQQSTSSADWALNRASPTLRDRFRASFGDLDVSVCEFTRGHGSNIDLLDIGTLLPWLSSPGGYETAGVRGAAGHSDNGPRLQQQKGVAPYG